MAEIVFGKSFVDENTVLVNLINVNSPMVYDATMLGALKVYARHNQACVVSPFILAGAMSPVTAAGTLAQLLAEAMAGIALTQLIRPGVPVIFGVITTDTIEQAVERAGTKAGNKGAEAAMSALEMATLLDKIRS